MKKFVALLFLLCSSLSLMAAYQYETKANQVMLVFNSSTTVAFDLSRSGKDKDHENFIDRGQGVADYGWYNLETGETGSFANGAAATFNENDKIGVYVKDNSGKVYISTRSDGDADFGAKAIFGHADDIDGSIALYGGNNGSNGTHEYYVFKVNTANASGKTPSGQPLPGIIATLIVGGGTLVYLKKRKKLYASK